MVRETTNKNCFFPDSCASDSKCTFPKPVSRYNLCPGRSIFYGIRRDISYLGGSLVYLTPELLNWLKFVTSSSLRNQLLTRFFSTRTQKIWITHWISLRLFLPSLILKLRVLSNQIELKSPVASLLVIIKVITRQKYFYNITKKS